MEWVWTNLPIRLKWITYPVLTKLPFGTTPEKRLELEQILDRLPQKELARWALENSRDFLSLIDIGDAGEKNKIIRQAYEAFDARLMKWVLTSWVEKSRFHSKPPSLKIPKIKSLEYAAKSLYKLFQQPIWGRDAIVSADYAIKVRESPRCRQVRTCKTRTRKADQTGWILFS